MGAGRATVLTPALGDSSGDLAERAAVEITLANGKHLGVGLALEVPGRGPVVLTCHHVVASVPVGDVRVKFHDGTVRTPKLDDEGTRKERDVAVLIVDDPPELTNPLLHAPGSSPPENGLAGRGYSPGQGTGSFGVLVGARAWNSEFEGYVLPTAFALGSDDSRPGVSGSPVLCEDGVIGLVHAGRDESSGAARAVLLGPITAWQDGLPELVELLEPFVTRQLRVRAAVYSGRRAPKFPRLQKPARDARYLERPEEHEARRRLANGTLCLVGRENSGKSRLVCQLLRDHPEAIVVIPERNELPPDPDLEFDLRRRHVILVFDNIHVAAKAWNTLAWFDRFKRLEGRTTLVLTASNGVRWEKVQRAQEDLFEALPSDPVFLSETEGRDLDEDEGWQLAQEIGMDWRTFKSRFDGTPGSVLVDADAPPPTDDALPDGQLTGTAITTVTAERTNLPELTSSFLGRDADLAALRGLLGARALVTVTGPMGVGKTRLAIRLGRAQVGDYPDGVWFADLSAARDGGQVVDIVARSVRAGNRLRVEGEQALTDELRGHRALVILNGPDFVATAAARLAAKLTEGDPVARVLVTAEAPLGLPWETVLPLQPLSSSEDAERLFLDRSGLGEDAVITDAQRSRIEPLYEELGGNAAALEIAAAQVRASGLERTTGVRDSGAVTAADARGDVLRLAVMRSLEDVPAAEASVFARLGAMADWFTLAAARTVSAGEGVRAADVPDHVRALVDRQLVLIDTRDASGQRYRLLPSLSAIAAERLQASGEADAVYRRHAEHYLESAEQAALRLQGRSGRKWLTRLEADQQHLRAALQWSMDHDHAIALRLASALWMPCIARSNFAEGRRWIGQIVSLALPDVEQLGERELAALMDVVIGGSYLAYHQADYGGAEDQLALAAEIERRSGAAPLHAHDLNLRGLIARRHCRFDEAQTLLAQAASVSREEDDRPRFADRLNTIANAIRESRGDLDQAVALQEQSLAIYRRLGDLRGGAMAQCDLAYALLDKRESADRVRVLFEDSRETREAIKDKQGVAQSLNGLGHLEREVGRPGRAIRRHAVALELFEGMGDRLRVAETLEALALAEIARGHGRKGHARLERAEAERDRFGASRPPAFTAALERTLESRPPRPGRSGRFPRNATPAARSEPRRQPDSPGALTA